MHPLNNFNKKYFKKEALVCLSLYDAIMAKIASKTDIDLLLVGDSLGMCFAGHTDTLKVTIEECIYHTKAVLNGASNKLVVSDLPFMSYQISIEQALKNAARLIQEGGCHAVKLEGGIEMAPTIFKMTQAGISVMGHIGIMPQHFAKEGGYYIKGRKEDEQTTLLNAAKALQDAGAFAIVLEGVQQDLAKKITKEVDIPTIGIGSGINCNGQIQVINDILGLNENFLPKHAKKYINLYQEINQALNDYQHEVSNLKFPCQENSFN